MDDPSSPFWKTAGLDAGAAEALAEGLPASEAWSLLLNIFARRAEGRAPADLLRQWEQDRFVQPAFIDQRTLNALDGHLLAAAEGFEAIELSPLAPLGSCSAVGLASQNKTVSALRGTEVVSDPTNAMALECARRLRRDAGQVVRLATCHRCVRAQTFPSCRGTPRISGSSAWRRRGGSRKITVSSWRRWRSRSPPISRPWIGWDGMDTGSPTFG
jgi:hypothetical protein